MIWVQFQPLGSVVGGQTHGTKVQQLIKGVIIYINNYLPHRSLISFLVSIELSLLYDIFLHIRE